MISPQFKSLYSKLNHQQKQAVDEIEGPVMVIAGPGTGKTQILTLRIANILLKTQINPENILALTFTESAKSEMRQRLVDMIGTPGYKVEIYTFHSFCNEVIQRHPENFPHLISAKSITEVEQIQLLEKIIAGLDLKYLKPMGDPLYYLKPALSEISNLKKEGVDPESLEKAVKTWQENFDTIDDLYHGKGKYKGEIKGKYRDLQKEIYKTGELLQIYQAYQKQLKDQQKYDFNDMLMEAKISLEKDGDLLLRLQEKYQYILIDEHQDTNTAQNQIVELLGSYFENNPNTFVVGDEKQAIFRFQGASFENFLYFQKIYPGTKLVHLSENYRSHQKILDAADSLIVNNISANLLLSQKINLRSQQKKAEPIKLAVLNDYFAEYQFIAEDIQNKIKRGIIPSEIAIIGRNNRDLNLAAETLERCGIPFVIHSDQNVLQDLHIQKLIFTLRAVWNIGSELDLLKAMHLDLFNIEPLDIYKLMGFSRQNKLSVYESLSKLITASDEKLNLSSLENLKNFYQVLNVWQKMAHNDTFERLFIGVVEESGFREAILKHGRRYELLDKLTALFEEIKILVGKNPDFSLGDFLQYLELCQKHELPLKSHVETVGQNAVRLMTAHRSKGLEFDYVYIINVYDGHWGNSRKRSAGFELPWDILGIKLSIESAENEDERRLFYVAMTRARKDIILTLSTRGVEGNERIPSQFLSEIDKRLIEEVDTKKFEKGFLANKDIIFNPRPTLKLPAKNKDFFRKLFLTRGLSATALSNYQKCPWQFFYRNLLQFPEAKENYLIFGTAIHHALDCYISQRHKQTLTGHFLIEKFRESLDKEALSELERKALLERGQQALLGYFDNVIPNWTKEIQSELVIRGVKLSDEVSINGRIDMIEILSGHDVAVHDFKTGKVKSRSQIDGSNEKSGYNYLQQLVFYKILLDRYKNGLMKMTEGVIDFVEPDEKGRFKSERFNMSEELAKSLEEKILFIAKEIINLEFWDRRCEEPKCEYCQLRNLTM